MVWEVRSLAEITPSLFAGGMVRFRFPALDGLRAIAVLAVLAFHFDLGLPGGFLGVDVFFVLSGFLITNLLLRERLISGRVHLPTFYLRRIRRLVPALLLLAVGVLMAGVLFAPDSLSATRHDLPWAAALLLNWAQIFTEQSYWVAMGRPPLLQHLWSLSIEEQFYFLWPAAIWLLGTRIRVLLFSAVGATLVAAWQFWLSLGIGSDPSRLYLGSDTHSMGLLIGAALAAAWRPVHQPLTPDRRTLTSAVGLSALATLALAFTQVHGQSTLLYRWGFIAVNLAVAALIWSATCPNGLAKILGLRPLRWLGERSYGIYLWHWPIAVLLRPGIDVPWSDWQVQIMRIALTLSLAAASYKYVEMPVRDGRALRWWQSIASKGKVAGIAIAAGLTLVLGLTTSPAVVQAAAQPSAMPTVFVDAESIGSDPATPTDQDLALAKHGKVLILGDSVVISGRAALKSTLKNARIDAAVGRQADEIAKRVKERRKKDKLPADIVLHMGTNGLIEAKDLRSALTALSDRRRVVLVNVAVPRVWMKPSNKVISQVAKNFQNVRIADWAKVSHGHREYFTPDGVHLTEKGAKAFAKMVQKAIDAA